MQFKKINKAFNSKIDEKLIKERDITTLTPGSGISLLTGDIRSAMDSKLHDIAKNNKKDIKFLDKGKLSKQTYKSVSNLVKSIREHLAKNPFNLNDISNNISITKKIIKSYKKIYKKMNSRKITKKHSGPNNILDDRNVSWTHTIGNLILKNKSVVIIAGASHLDTSLHNNVIDLLKKEYNIIAEHKQYSQQ